MSPFTTDTILRGVFKGHVLEIDEVLYFRIAHPMKGFNWFFANKGTRALEIVHLENQVKYLEDELQHLLAQGAEDLCCDGGG